MKYEDSINSINMLLFYCQLADYNLYLIPLKTIFIKLIIQADTF